MIVMYQQTMSNLLGKLGDMSSVKTLYRTHIGEINYFLNSENIQYVMISMVILKVKMCGGGFT